MMTTMFLKKTARKIMTIAVLLRTEKESYVNQTIMKVGLLVRNSLRSSSSRST